MFQDALVAQGLPPATVIAWQDLVEPGAPARLLADLPREAILRIDSAGENDDVERALIRRGEQAARAERYTHAIDAKRLELIPRELGRILYPRQQHLGFVSVLREIDAAIAPGWRVVQPVRAIEELFDKRVTSAKWSALGIPVPDALRAVRDPDDLRAAMRDAGWPEVFVKVS